MIGHILWLVGISLATDTARINQWVLVVAAVSFVAGAVGAWLGWRQYKQNSRAWAMLLWFLPLSPVLFSIGVLGVTYL